MYTRAPPRATAGPARPTHILCLPAGARQKKVLPYTKKGLTTKQGPYEPYTPENGEWVFGWLPAAHVTLFM